MTTVINLHHIKKNVDLNEWAKEPGNVYIGRPSLLLPDACTKWGNNNRPKNKTKKAMAECLDLYRKDIETVTEEKNLLADLHELKGKVLGCWCDGECHGNVLVELVHKYLLPQSKLSTSSKNNDACTISGGLCESYAELLITDSEADTSTDSDETNPNMSPDASLGGTGFKFKILPPSPPIHTPENSSPKTPLGDSTLQLCERLCSLSTNINEEPENSINNNDGSESIETITLSSTFTEETIESSSPNETNETATSFELPDSPGAEDAIEESTPEEVTSPPPPYADPNEAQKALAIDQELFNRNMIEKLSYIEKVLKEVLNTNSSLKESIDVINEKTESNSNRIALLEENEHKKSSAPSNFPASLNDNNTRLENLEIAIAQFESKCSSIQDGDKDLTEARLDILENNLSSMNSSEKSHFDDIVILSTKIESLEAEIARLNQYGRKENIILSGIPDNIGHNQLEKVVIKLLRDIGVKDLEAQDITACHRLKFKTNGETSKRVIIRFINRKFAESCMQNKKSLNRYARGVRIHEDICPAYKRIYDSCEELLRNGKIESLWFFNGVINIRRHNERYKSIKIFHQNDLIKYVPCPVDRGLNPTS